MSRCLWGISHSVFLSQFSHGSNGIEACRRLFPMANAFDRMRKTVRSILKFGLALVDVPYAFDSVL
jgi:hypothetical protein